MYRSHVLVCGGTGCTSSNSLAIIEALKSEGEYYAIGFKKGSDLTAKVNGALEALAADGTIATIAAKYGLTNTAITDFSDQK